MCVGMCPSVAPLMVGLRALRNNLQNGKWRRVASRMQWGNCPKAAAQPEQNTTFAARAERQPSVTLHTRAPFAAVVPPPASTPRSPPRQGVALQASLINRLSYLGRGKAPGARARRSARPKTPPSGAREPKKGGDSNPSRNHLGAGRPPRGSAPLSSRQGRARRHH